MLFDGIDLASPEGLVDFEVLCALAHDTEYVWLTSHGVASRSRLELLAVLASLDRLLAGGRVALHPTKHHLYGVRQ